MIMRRFSTKRKKELYSLSSLLLHLAAFILLLISLGTDADEKAQANAGKANNSKEASHSLNRFFASATP